MIADLPENERKTLLTMAANGVSDTAFFLASLLIELASFGDSSVGDRIARWTSLPPAGQLPCRRTSVAVFVVAHFALARLGCPLPARRGEADGHSTEALAACGAILYWFNRVSISPSTLPDTRNAPVYIRRRLVAEYARLDVAINPPHVIDVRIHTSETACMTGKGLIRSLRRRAKA